LAVLTGGLMGMDRVSVLPGADTFDAHKMASKRNMKISDSIGRAPWFQRLLPTDLAGICCWRLNL
jgi:hypothetical protein